MCPSPPNCAQVLARASAGSILMALVLICSAVPARTAAATTHQQGRGEDETKPLGGAPYPTNCAILSNVPGCSDCNATRTSNDTQPDLWFNETVACTACGLGYELNASTGQCDCIAGWGSFMEASRRPRRRAKSFVMPSSRPNCTAANDIMEKLTFGCWCSKCPDGLKAPVPRPVLEAVCQKRRGPKGGRPHGTRPQGGRPGAPQSPQVPQNTTTPPESSAPGTSSPPNSPPAGSPPPSSPTLP